MNQVVLPKHIGIIMDGNRRWAKGSGVAGVAGHRQGLEVLVKTVEHAHRRGIKYLTVYAFSTENWNRQASEVNYLMELAAMAFKKHLKRLHQNSVRLVMLGDYNGVSEKIADNFKEAETLTANNTGLVLGVCFNYGGQLEIVEGVRRMINDGVKAEEVDEAKISDYLYSPDIPPIDIMVRTSGEHRISNFMLWRIAYSELLFIDKHWPDFNENDLDAVIAEFGSRQRRFGA